MCPTLRSYERGEMSRQRRQSENMFHRDWVVKTGFCTRDNFIQLTHWLLVGLTLILIGLTQISSEKNWFKPPCPGETFSLTFSSGGGDPSRSHVFRWPGAGRGDSHMQRLYDGRGNKVSLLLSRWYLTYREAKDKFVLAFLELFVDYKYHIQILIFQRRIWVYAKGNILN